MPRPRTRSDLTISELENILERRRQRLAGLERERSRAARRLDQIDREIASVGGNGAGRMRGGGRRIRNEKSLNEAIADVLKGASGPMKVGDIVDKVQAGGYRSNSANFRGIVNQTLIKDKRFNSASRGLYQMKK